MIPPLEEIFGSCTFLARRFSWELSPRNVRLVESITARHAEIVDLGASPEDEPAAIFFALSRDHFFLGEDYLALPIMVSTNHATALGLEFRASRVELIDQARWISAGLVSYEDVRAWFAARLTPREPRR